MWRLSVFSGDGTGSLAVLLSTKLIILKSVCHICVPWGT